MMPWHRGDLDECDGRPQMLFDVPPNPWPEPIKRYSDSRVVFRWVQTSLKIPLGVGPLAEMFQKLYKASTTDPGRPAFRALASTLAATGYLFQRCTNTRPVM
jgi:hypothetical protein